MKLTLSLTLVLLFSSTACYAADWYIAPKGDDRTTCQKNSPCASFARAQSMASPGDTIYLRGGSYPASWTAWISKNNLTVKKYLNEIPLIDNEYQYPKGNFNDVVRYQGTIHIRANNVTINGLHIRKGRGIGILSDGDNNTIRNCNIELFYHTGIAINLIYTNGGKKVIYRNDNVIEGNTVTRCNYLRELKGGAGAWGILSTNIAIRGKRHIVKHNISRFAHSSGLEALQSEGSLYEYNILYGNGITQFHLAEDRNEIFRYNICYGVKRPTVPMDDRANQPINLDIVNKTAAGAGPVDLMCELWRSQDKDGITGYWDTGHEVYGNLIANTTNGIRIGCQQGVERKFPNNNVRNFKIYNNTIINPNQSRDELIYGHALVVMGKLDKGVQHIGPGHVIKNNIFWSDAKRSITLPGLPKDRVAIGPNLWSKAPGKNYQHPDDPGYPTYDKLNISDYFRKTLWNNLQAGDLSGKDFELLESAAQAIDTGEADDFFLSLEIPFTGAVDMGGKQMDYDPPQTEVSVTSLSLINTDTGQVIRDLSGSGTVNLYQYPNFSIRANTTPASVGSVVFNVDNAPFKTENASPFALAGDNGQGVYNRWGAALGMHTIEAIPFSDRSGAGTAGIPLSVTLNIVESQEQKETLYPDEDAYLENGATRNIDSLKIQNSPTRVRESFLKFTVSGLSGRDVESALLKITCAADPGSGELSVYLGGHSNWNEENLAYSEPPKDALIDSMESAYTTGTEYVFDVSSVLTTDGEYTFILSLGSGGNDVSFHSSEGAVQPELEITSR